ncbi:hypothetical protein [Halobacillus seohaensis]|uniref:Uncharacterized protein n=1 Tax=Halobacillus seohaensis TaxID=447421 RepID=A0ABW2ERM7_9BACI
MSAYDNYKKIYELEDEIRELKDKLKNRGSTTEQDEEERENDDFLFLIVLFCMLEFDVSTVTNMFKNREFLSPAIDILKGFKKTE